MKFRDCHLLGAALLLCGAAHAQPYAYIVEVGDWPAGTAKLHCYYNSKEAEAGASSTEFRKETP